MRSRSSFSHTVVLIGVLSLFCLAVGLFWYSGAAKASTPTERIDESLRVLKDMAPQEDFGAMTYLLKQARGVAIFPSVLKAGLMLGASHGQGLVLRRDQATGAWYGPEFVEMTSLSWGPQIGVQSTALVLIITSERGLKGFADGKITLGGEVSVSAGPVGRQAEAGANLDLSAAVYSYSMSKGAFAGASLEGAKISPDDSANELYWGAKFSPDAILSGKPVDRRARMLADELNRIISRTR